MTLTQKQQDYINAHEQDIDMAFEYSDISYLNQYPSTQDREEEKALLFAKRYGASWKGNEQQ